jgi:hypothetical protein
MSGVRVTRRMRVAAMLLVQALGAIRTIEFMTFAGHSNQRSSGKNHQQGSFHRQRS